MHEYLDNLLLWTQENDMKINISKTKELPMGPWGRFDIAPLQTISGIIERVSEVKLLGVYIDPSLSWNKHINYIAGKAGKRLYFLKILKRSGVPRDHRLHYYIAVIRSVLEYCSCIWHHNIPQSLSIHTESIQKRALRRISLNCRRDTSYAKLLADTGIFSLQQRRNIQAKILFSVNPPARLVSRLFVTRTTR